MLLNFQMTSFNLRLIAIITMLIDHIGAIFFPDMYFLRYLGRIAFPLFCFLLVQGFLHTHNIKKYILKMFVFSLISEIIFDLCFFNNPFYMNYQNVYFTLFFGLLTLYFYEKQKEKNKDGYYVILFFCCFSFLLKTDYNYLGILMIFMMYFYEKNIKKQGKIKILENLLLPITFIVFFIIELLTNSDSNNIIDSFLNYNWIYTGIFISLLLIKFYNGQQGFKNKIVQIGFYFFYPVHLLLIYLLYILIK